MCKLRNDKERTKTGDLLKQFHTTFQTFAAGFGWKIDNVSDLARVLRVPGTVNMKAEPVEVSVISSADISRYTLEDIEPHLIFEPPQEKTSRTK